MEELKTEVVDEDDGITIYDIIKPLQPVLKK